MLIIIRTKTTRPINRAATKLATKKPQPKLKPSRKVRCILVDPFVVGTGLGGGGKFLVLRFSASSKMLRNSVSIFWGS